MKILVTGANGQLGNEMQLCAKGSQDKYFFTDVCEGYEHLDITDIDAVREYVRAHGIQAIVNCAAWTNVDGAEDPARFELVEKLNATAPENLAKAMKEVGGLLVHISTDYVFGKEPYNVPCREDQVGTPTYALDLAKAIVVILGDYRRHSGLDPESRHTGPDPVSPYPRSGIYHFSNEGVCSWYDFTKMIQSIATGIELASADESVRLAGQQRLACNVQPCHSNEFPSPVTRPAFSVLDKTRIKETFGVEVPYWTDSLEKCIRNLQGI